jgi:RNA polymerase sigma-70 factor (ECF subfamily)
MPKKPAIHTNDTIFEKELLPHVGALQTFAYHLTYNQEDADDLVQETYLKAYRFIDKYEKGTNAKAWLFKILKNAYINEYRKRVKQPTKVDFEDIVAFHDTDDDRVSGYSDLREEIFLHMMGDEVTSAINSLPLDFRTVILLCDIEGFTYEEIAAIIDVPIGTVRSRLFRARNLLKEKLTVYAQQHGYTDIRGQKKSKRISSTKTKEHDQRKDTDDQELNAE